MGSGCFRGCAEEPAVGPLHQRSADARNGVFPATARTLTSDRRLADGGPLSCTKFPRYFSPDGRRIVRAEDHHLQDVSSNAEGRGGIQNSASRNNVLQNKANEDMEQEQEQEQEVNIFRVGSSCSTNLLTPSDEEEDTCAICCEELHRGPTSVLKDNRGRRVCRHYYHTRCLRLIESAEIRQCPLCRRDFNRVEEVPSPTKNPRGWFRTVDADGSMQLSKTEVVDALGAVFPIDSKLLEENLDVLWERWDSKKSGAISLPEFENSEHGLLQWVKKNQHYRAKKTTATPLSEDRGGNGVAGRVATPRYVNHNNRNHNYNINYHNTRQTPPPAILPDVPLSSSLSSW